MRKPNPFPPNFPYLYALKTPPISYHAQTTPDRKGEMENHHLSVPYRVLEHKYGFKQNGKQDQPADSENKIIRGDNLEALKSLLPEYEGKIKCIYIDPPYNTGNEGWVYNDNVNSPTIKKWLGEVVGKEGEDLSQ